MQFNALSSERKEEAEHSLYVHTHTTKHLTLLAKSKRSQSALEYMMTYGWAILIIVIVAVILYSMGIFNPSSSVTFTSSGFSPFTVSSSLCNNLGYKIAVIAGPIPNNANSLTISKVYLTSATGANTTTASYTLTNPVTLKSGQSATILIPTVACNAANVHYSMSANIEYSYTVPTIGLQTINTTGTVAGTSIAGKPSVLTAYEPVTVTNSQSSSTPSPFQQMVNFTSLDSGWTSISTGNFGQNVEFFYYNGTVIPSWLESYTSSYAIWWLKLGSIPAGSSETVYVGFAPSTTNLFNTVNDGEAPQIPCIEEGVTNTSQCSIYAEYDNGANTFNFYDNFAGTTLNITKWTPPGSAYIINNKLQLTGASPTLESVDTYSAPLIIEIYRYTTMSNWFGFNFPNSWEAGGVLFYDQNGWSTYQGSSQLSGGSESLNMWYIQTGILAPFGQALEDIDYVNMITSGLGYYSGTSGSLSIDDGGGAGTIQWIRTRAYPPNGVMPSVSFGSVA